VSLHIGIRSTEIIFSATPSKICDFGRLTPRFEILNENWVGWRTEIDFSSYCDIFKRARPAKETADFGKLTMMSTHRTQEFCGGIRFLRGTTL
jgi:hypothetical protein